MVQVLIKKVRDERDFRKCGLAVQKKIHPQVIEQINIKNVQNCKETHM